MISFSRPHHQFCRLGRPMHWHLVPLPCRGYSDLLGTAQSAVTNTGMMSIRNTITVFVASNTARSLTPGCLPILVGRCVARFYPQGAVIRVYRIAMQAAAHRVRRQPVALVRVELPYQFAVVGIQSSPVESPVGACFSVTFIAAWRCATLDRSALPAPVPVREHAAVALSCS